MTITEHPDEGDHQNFDETFFAIRAQIEALARRSRGHKALQLSTAEIVQEAYLKMRSSVGDRKLDRMHFKRLAGIAIRHILADVARRRTAGKRGGQFLFVTLIDASSLPYPIEKQLDIDRALKRLYEEDAELAQFIDMRFFGGCTDAELADLFELSTATVQRRVRNGLAWLKLVLTGKLVGSL